MDIHDSIADLIGNTPMVRLKRFGRSFESKGELVAKCEFLNPGGSVKDRIAFHMVKKAEEKGLLKPGGTIVEATAGNTGIGLALAAALGGYKLIAVMSQKVSTDKVRMLESLGAEAIVVPSGTTRDHPEHFMNKAKSLAQEDGAWLCDQFFNEFNIEAHYQSTGPEIWKQTEGQVDAIVAGVGTGGTITGAGRYLKEKKPSLKVILADPKGSMLKALVEGKEPDSSSYLVEGIGQDFVPGNFDIDLVDKVIEVDDRSSIEAAKELWQTEAMFVGSSAGCIIHAARQYLLELEPEKEGRTMVVPILPDNGRSYMSTIYNPDWLAEKLQN